MQYSVRGRQRGSASMSLLWQTVTDTVKTLKSACAAALYVSVSIFSPAPLHVRYTWHIWFVCVPTNTHICSRTPGTNSSGTRIFRNRRQAFGCWIFHICILDSFHLSVSWPSRWEVRYALAYLSLFGEIQQSHLHSPVAHFLSGRGVFFCSCVSNTIIPLSQASHTHISLQQAISIN